MDMRCKRRNCCKMCFLEACPFGRCGEPSETEYPTAKNKCKFYNPQDMAIRGDNGRIR
jgi:hypothetical protein